MEVTYHDKSNSIPDGKADICEVIKILEKKYYPKGTVEHRLLRGEKVETSFFTYKLKS